MKRFTAVRAPFGWNRGRVDVSVEQGGTGDGLVFHLGGRGMDVWNRGRVGVPHPVPRPLFHAARTKDFAGWSRIKKRP